MWYPPKTVTAVASEPVSLAQAKAQCRVETLAEDDLFGLLIAAARGHAEKICGQYFAARTIETYCDDFADLARFDVAPISEIDAITFVGKDGADELLSPDIYDFRNDGMEAGLVLKPGNRWPERQMRSRVKATLRVGGEEIEPEVIHAMLLLIGAWYENREETVIGVSIGSLPTFASVDALLCNNRRFL